MLRRRSRFIYSVFMLMAITSFVGSASINIQAQVTTFVPNCSGIDDTLEFTTLINGAAGNPRTIRIPYYDDLNQRCKVTTMTVPAHITLDNSDGIGITVDNPEVLTVLGPVVNPVGKTLFFGTGTTSFAGNTFVGSDGQARLTDGAGVESWGTPVGMVSETRSINTTGPLTGGGDLSTDRTIACDTCAVTSSPLSQFAFTTSAQLASTVTDETGTGALVFGTSPIFTGNVGIGTTASQGTLHTKGQFLFFDDSAGNISGGIYANALAAQPFSIWSGSGDFRIGTGVKHRMTGTGFLERIRILNSNGNVGIGTSSPTTKLQVSTASANTNFAGLQLADTPLALRNTNPTNNNLSLISLQDASGSGNVVFGGIQSDQTNHSGEFLLMTRDAGVLDERLRVDRTGNFLLGTNTSPAANAGKVLAFGENGATNPTMGANTAGIFAKSVAGITTLFAIDEDGTAAQLTGSGGSTTTPAGANGDLQMKAGTNLAASAINDNGSVLSLNRQVNTAGNLLVGTTTTPTTNSGKVLTFGDNGATNPTMGVNTAGIFAKSVDGTTKLFAIDDAGTATQLNEDATHLFVTDAEKTTWNNKQNALGFTAENQANKSTSTSLGTSDTLYPTQNAVKTYVDSLAFGGGSGPGGVDGDLQMKSGAGFAPSAINDDGSAISFNRPVRVSASDNAFARWTFNNDNSLSLAATLAPPTAPSASLLADVTGACTAGIHQFKVTYVTPAGETDASPASNAITCSATQTKVTITLPTGGTTFGVNTIATGRNIYATTAGGSTYFRIAPSPVVNNNTATSYTFSIADGSFSGSQVPTANTAVDDRIFVDNLGNVGFGTTQPKFTDDSQGRSVAIDGGSTYGYLGIGTTSVTDVTGRVGGLHFYNIAQGGVDHRLAAIIARNDGALGKGSLHFMTSASIIGPSGAGSINSEQNWGIGRDAVNGVKLIVQAANADASNRVFAMNNWNGTLPFVNVWNDGKFQLSNGKFQVDAGPFQVSSTGEVDAQSLQLTSAAKPICDAPNRGKFWYVAGGAGIKDTVEVCAKDAADAFAWRVIF